MSSITFDTETELHAINSILGAIGQSSVTTLNFENPEVALIYRTLNEVSVQVQSEGWSFNTEYHYPLTPDEGGEIVYPDNVIQMDLCDTEDPSIDTVRRNGKLYDKYNHTFVFEAPIYFDMVWKFDFEDLPSPFKQYITYRASRIVAAKLVGDKEIYALLQDQENVARVICMEYECNQGDYNYLGYPRGTTGYPYRPYQALIR
jgi:hypothetical protein